MNLLALRETSRGSLPDIRASDSWSAELAGEPYAFHVALGDTARDAILVSELSRNMLGSSAVPAALTMPSLTRECRVVQINGSRLSLEYGIYRLR